MRRLRDAACDCRSGIERRGGSTGSPVIGHHRTGMKAKILIVDDSALTRRSLRQILETADCEVVEAENGLDALERYFLDKPDVVMLDLVMRGMYGLEVLQKLRELDPRARIVVVSADIQTSSHDL